jgi:hypothetical protein
VPHLLLLLLLQGREVAAALMDHIKVGSIVSIKGKVQQNPAAAKAQAPGSSSSSRNVLDVVAHEVVLLHKSRDMLSKSIRAAQRQGATGVTTAAQLLQLQQQQQQGAGAVNSMLWDRRQDPAAGFPSASRGNSNSNSSNRLASSSQGSATAGGGSSSSSSSSNGRPPSSQPRITKQAAAAAAADTGSPVKADSVADSDTYWQLPPEIAGSIHWVDTEHGIKAMQQLVLPQHSDVTNGSSSSSGVPEVVVGMDCEWRPYERHNPATPVALLQLATRRHVFLVDLLAICQQQQQQQHAGALDNSSTNGSRSSSRSEDSSSSSVTAAEAALSSFLLQLLLDPRLVKVGFQLGTDLERLQVRGNWQNIENNCSLLHVLCCFNLCMPGIVVLCCCELTVTVARRLSRNVPAARCLYIDTAC